MYHIYRANNSELNEKCRKSNALNPSEKECFRGFVFKHIQSEFSYVGYNQELPEVIKCALGLEYFGYMDMDELEEAIVVDWLYVYETLSGLFPSDVILGIFGNSHYIIGMSREVEPKELDKWKLVYKGRAPHDNFFSKALIMERVIG